MRLPRPHRSPSKIDKDTSVRELLLLALCALLGFLLLYRSQRPVTQCEASPKVSAGGRGGLLSGEEARRHGPVLVSYSYFEKDGVQRANLEFFAEVGMGASAGFERPRATDFVVVVSGEACSPCGGLSPELRPVDLGAHHPQLAWAKAGPGLALLQRAQNEGMDFAAHNVTLEWVRRQGTYRKYRFFIFLNSSARGPFFPKFMPRGWQWTQAFTELLQGRVRLVSTSLVCLPDVDAGGPGPKAESWAYALDAEGLDTAVRATVFHRRTCKLCPDGIVVKGEYGLTQSILDAGYNVDSLLLKYRQGLDWHDSAHWRCNDNVHPSRHGTYDHISMATLETVFIKASWHVGEPFTSKHTEWLRALGRGEAGTAGAADLERYRYAISPEAQEPPDVAECYRVNLG